MLACHSFVDTGKKDFITQSNSSSWEFSTGSGSLSPTSWRLGSNYCIVSGGITWRNSEIKEPESSLMDDMLVPCFTGSISISEGFLQ